MRWLLASLLALISGLAFGQTRDFSGGRLSTPPALDGKVEADEYKDAIRLDGLVDTQTGAAAPEGGMFYLAYDTRFVYFAARLVDRHPSSIQATEFRTNVNLDGDDTVSLSLDPFGTLSDFNSFTMNARGATNLGIAGGKAAKREWLGDFASKGRVTSEGWEVEARIPWSVMRLPGRGPHDLRFNIYRNHRRLQRFYAWTQTSNGLVQNYGRWKTVDLPSAQASNLQALPYFYGGAADKTGLVANAGVDLRYSLNRDLDLVGTINPDFRNIERGVLSLDFSYFQRIADETRPFFIEGGEYFQANGDAPIFVPQQIQNFDAGAKMFGKLNASTDIGVLATADFGHDDAFVGRIHRQIDPRTSWAAQYAGGTVGGRRTDALAGIFGMATGNWEFGTQLSATEDPDRGTGHRAVVTSYYEQKRTWLFSRYAEITGNFLPALGFAPQTNYRGVNTFGGQSWTSPKHGLIDYGFEGGFLYQRSYDLNDPFHEGASIYPHARLKDGTGLNMTLAWDRFFGGAGDQTYGLSIRRPAGNPYRNWGLSYASGTRAGSSYRDLGVGFAYRPLPTLQVNGTLQDTTYLGQTMDQTIVSANYDLDQYHSVGGRAVVSPAGTNWYLSFRQSGNRGAEYYLILGDPNAATFRTSLILKAVFPFSLKA